MIIHSPIISGSLTFANGATFTAPASSEYSGSFSGSFVGDGSSLTGVTSYTDADTLIYINSRGVLSGSAQLTSEFDTRYLNTESDGIVSGSSQIDGTSITNNSLTIAGTSVALGDTITYATITNGTGTISGSAQLTSEFDTRYLNTNSDGIISSSQQVNADSITNFDTNVRAAVSATGDLSYNSSTGVFSFTNDAGDIEGVTAGTGLTGGGTSGTVTLNVVGGDGITANANDIAVDGTVLRTTGDGVVSGSGQIDGTSITNNSLTIAGTAVALGDTITYATITNGTGTVSGSSQLYTDTDDITEGSTNLYYTDGRVKSKLNTEGVISGSEQITITQSQISDLDHYTDSDWDTRLASKSTTNLSEGTNLYYTDARVKTKLNTEGVISGSSQITITESQISDLSHYGDSDVKTKLNTEDVVSGSASQVRSFINVENGADVTDTTNVVASLTAGTNIAIAGDGTISSTDTNTQLSTEQVQDIAGPLVATGGTKTGITVTYDDANGNMDFVVATQSDENFTSALLSKLNGIETSADVTDTTNVTAAGALMDSEVDVDIKTLSLPANTTISTFGASLIDDADASAARTTLGVDEAGTDNSTNVTLAGTRNYITISGQTITRNVIDISDDTNLAVSDTSGQTGINLTLSGDTLSGVVSGLGTGASPQFTNLTVTGDLTVSGTTTSINSTNLNVTDKLIELNRGGSTAASADGGGLFISGANESLTWDNGNSRFTFSDDLNVGGNITLSGTVDGVDIAALNTTVGNINTQVPAITSNGSTPSLNTGITAAEVRSLIGVDAAGTNNYTHPTHAGDDISIDTTALTGATVISDLDFNITTDTNGHVTDANGTVSTRDLTLADLGYTGETDATADQTAAEILTLLKTVDGAGSGLDADKLDGLTSGNFLRSNATDTASGVITFSNSAASSTTTSGAVIVTGGVGIGGALNVGGDVVAYASSDERLKDNIELISNPIEKVQSLKGVTWNWNENADELQQSLPNVGVIAQDVEKVLPQLVTDRDNGFKGVDYAKLTGLLIEAIKEQQKQIDELKSKIQ